MNPVIPMIILGVAGVLVLGLVLATAIISANMVALALFTWLEKRKKTPRK